jgi:hypothetical protein
MEMSSEKDLMVRHLGNLLLTRHFADTNQRSTRPWILGEANYVCGRALLPLFSMLLD